MQGFQEIERSNDQYYFDATLSSVDILALRDNFRRFRLRQPATFSTNAPHVALKDIAKGQVLFWFTCEHSTISFQPKMHATYSFTVIYLLGRKRSTDGKDADKLIRIRPQTTKAIARNYEVQQQMKTTDNPEFVLLCGNNEHCPNPFPRQQDNVNVPNVGFQFIVDKAQGGIYIVIAYATRDIPRGDDLAH